MKRRTLVVVALAFAAVVAACFGWQWYSWDTVCAADAPDGSRRALVRCHRVPTMADPRYHYYLSFDPSVEFRPVECDSTLKWGASAVNNERATFDWAATHYLGYLQGLDNVDERGPSVIEWQEGRVVVRSR
jgi:hypothetical protein